MRIGLNVIGIVVLLVVAACSAEPAKDTPRDGAAGAEPGPGASQATPEAEGRREGPLVLVLGTSLTAGLGLDPSDAYPALLQQKADSAGLPARIVNAGLSGETSAGALRRLEWLLTDTPSAVFIETGANDGLRGLNVDSTRENLRAIVRRVKEGAPDARILLAQMESPPNLGERYTSSFRQMFQTVAREEGITLVPFMLDGVAGVAQFNQGDGIHPNEDGARIVADNVWPFLESVLRQLTSG
jgi:acyl-CoA thioesterase-1